MGACCKTIVGVRSGICEGRVAMQMATGTGMQV